MARILMMDHIEDFDFDVNDDDSVIFIRDDIHHRFEHAVAIYDLRGFQVGWLRERGSPLMHYVLSKTGEDLMIIANVNGNVVFGNKMEIKVHFIMSLLILIGDMK